MQITGVINKTSYADFSTEKQSNSNTVSFGEYLSAATAQQAEQAEDPIQAFLNYASETPAQRMLDSWLKTQNMTIEQFNALPSEEQKAILEKFKQAMKDKMNREMGISQISNAIAL